MESVIRLNREIFVNMLLALLLVASSLTTAATDWATVLAGEHRSESNRARDSFRNPAQTLEFFGVTPSSVVVEMYPGGGLVYRGVSTRTSKRRYLVRGAVWHQ